MFNAVTFITYVTYKKRKRKNTLGKLVLDPTAISQLRVHSLSPSTNCVVDEK